VPLQGNVIFAGIKAWLRNLINLKKLRMERKKIQKQRSVSDSELEKVMNNKSGIQEKS